MHDLGIVIVNLNTRDFLRECLRSIYASRGDITYKTYLVDNCSSDGSVEMVCAEFPEIDCVERCDHNIGYPAANNVGLRAAGFGGKETEPEIRYALLLNPDTVLPPDALQQIIDFADAHPWAGILGPKLVREDGSLDKACRRSFPSPEVSFYRLTGLARLFPNNPRFGTYNLNHLNPDEIAEVDAVVGAFMLIRADVIHEVGLMDESFFMYGEDLDFCYRAKQKGWKVLYYPAVTVLHYKGQSSKQRSRQATYHFYRSMYVFHRKHYWRSTFLPLNWLITLGIVVLGGWALIRNALRPPGRKRVASA
jgi:GT2 family glycosyltransferase